jgi:hypothetical protein
VCEEIQHNQIVILVNVTCCTESWMVVIRLSCTVTIYLMSLDVSEVGEVGVECWMDAEDARNR